MTPDEMKSRTKQFALRCMRLAAALPANVVGRALASQLVRCGTSVAANYRAACRARSKAEFVSKLGIVEEEADESGFWMELIVDGRLQAGTRIEALLKEADELVRIVCASIRTARPRARQSAIRNPQSAMA